MTAPKPSPTSPRPKRKPKPFARWSASCDGYLLYDGEHIGKTAGNDVVAALNKHRVVLKGKP